VTSRSSGPFPHATPFDMHPTRAEAHSGRWRHSPAPAARTCSSETPRKGPGVTDNRLVTPDTCRAVIDPIATTPRDSKPHQWLASLAKPYRRSDAWWHPCGGACPDLSA
jgi:hypothetical protein